ncbi:hypothetical protein FEM03_17405 [Phragmitibacter flavus]|uniref:Uncharacterized protein n=1 Tax=Phragmitibacter flavus TaxID=2576071 RepID=A0A5R8KAU0_9BACT|nr:hypothetical protein FEM03_17405 [Phragmitibacter flavus]
MFEGEGDVAAGGGQGGLPRRVDGEGILAEEEFEAVDGAVVVGVIAWLGVGGIGSGEVLLLPLGVTLSGGECEIDPVGEELFGGEVAFGGGERWHAWDAVAAETFEDHGAGGVAGNAEAIGGIAAVVDQGSTDEVGEIGGGGGAGIPGSGGGASGLVALDAVDFKVGADTPFKGGALVIGGGQGWQDVGVGDRLGKIAGVAECGDLVLGSCGGFEEAVHLLGVEAEGVAADRGVAGAAFVATGVAPSLGGAGGRDGFGLAFFGDEVGVGLIFAPFVGEAVDVGGSFDEEAGF